MSDIEKRARLVLADTLSEEGYDSATLSILREFTLQIQNTGQLPTTVALKAIAAALTPPEGYVLVPVDLPDMGEAPRFMEGHYSRSNWRAAIDDLRWLAARPEVP